jgi:hypothetical protein
MMAGRPKLPEAERRNKVVQVMCTTAEREDLKRRARAAGYRKVSDWMRALLFADAAEDVDLSSPHVPKTTKAPQ